MCRVPAGPPPQALYVPPTWLDAGEAEAGEAATSPTAGTLLPASAAPPLPADADADVDDALLDSLLLGGPAEPVKAEPGSAGAGGPPPPAVSAAADAPARQAVPASFVAPPPPPSFLAGMFAGLPLPLAYPAGPVSHTAAGQLAGGAAALKKVSELGGAHKKRGRYRFFLSPGRASEIRGAPRMRLTRPPSSP